MAMHEFNIHAEHLTSEENRLPDILSRWSLNTKYRTEFEIETKGMNLTEVHLVDELFRF
jgi:hypothetical protein